MGLLSVVYSVGASWLCRDMKSIRKDRLVTEGGSTEKRRRKTHGANIKINKEEPQPVKLPRNVSTMADLRGPLLWNSFRLIYLVYYMYISCCAFLIFFIPVRIKWVKKKADASDIVNEFLIFVRAVHRNWWKEIAVGYSMDRNRHHHYGHPEANVGVLLHVNFTCCQATRVKNTKKK